MGVGDGSPEGGCGDFVWLSGSKCADDVRELILCFLRVWGNGAGRVGPIHTVYRDLELRGEDRRKLQQSRVEC